MTPLFLYNTLSRQKEEFKPIKDRFVGLYTCGPTVYNYAHIGNLRTYIFEDVLKRTLVYNGYDVKHVMNITDVGHLTSDADEGEDKMEKGAQREGKSAWDIAEFYTQSFKQDILVLNVEEPNVWCKATDYIAEQIDLIKKLEEKGYTYRTSDGIYFDTSKFPDYNKLSQLKLEELEEGARVEVNPEKKNPTDFALWKFSPTGTKREMEWESPWGIGFPGWHVECSAMSLKNLDPNLDIHCGGVDHINVHHTNEIAQSEAATGKKFFNYWLHGAFLNIVGGKKMAKSADNFLTVKNALLDKNINPLAYRYAALQTHYRKPMEYSEESIEGAASGLNNLIGQVAALGSVAGEIDESLKDEFLQNINDDLNTAGALAVLQKTLKADISDADKLATIIDFDQILGLNLAVQAAALTEAENAPIPAEVTKLLAEREEARKSQNWAKSDTLREQIALLGYEVKDTTEGQRVVKT